MRQRHLDVVRSGDPTRTQRRRGREGLFYCVGNTGDAERCPSAPEGRTRDPCRRPPQVEIKGPEGWGWSTGTVDSASFWGVPPCPQPHPMENCESVRRKRCTLAAEATVGSWGKHAPPGQVETGERALSLEVLTRRGPGDWKVAGVAPSCVQP